MEYQKEKEYQKIFEQLDKMLARIERLDKELAIVKQQFQDDPTNAQNNEALLLLQKNYQQLSQNIKLVQDKLKILNK